MKTALSLAVLAVLLVAPGRCFALWLIAPVSPDRAKEMGLEVRSSPAGPDQVRVQLEFKTEGRFKEFSAAGQFKGRSGVELLIGEGKNPAVTAPLKEDRSKPGRIVVSFNADPAHLDQINLRVMVPEPDGGTIYQIRVKDFVQPEKGR
jgi:hypothetical protein